MHEVVVTAVSAAVRAAMTMRSAISMTFDFNFMAQRLKIKH